MSDRWRASAFINYIFYRNFQFGEGDCFRVKLENPSIRDLMQACDTARGIIRDRIKSGEAASDINQVDEYLTLKWEELDVCEADRKLLEMTTNMSFRVRHMPRGTLYQEDRARFTIKETIGRQSERPITKVFSEDEMKGVFHMAQHSNLNSPDLLLKFAQAMPHTAPKVEETLRRFVRHLKR